MTLVQGPCYCRRIVVVAEIKQFVSKDRIAGRQGVPLPKKGEPDEQLLSPCPHCITVQRPQCRLFIIIPPRVILGHTFFFALNYLDNPVWAMDKMNNSRSFEAILQGLFSVDSFFFLSGLLVAYIFTIKKDQIKDLGILFWCKFVLHRFLRLLPPYMALVGLSCW